LYDSPGGAFDFNLPGPLLSQIDLAETGTPSASAFSWTAAVAALDASQSKHGNVTVAALGAARRRHDAR
jgi:hypothetical protein